MWENFINFIRHNDSLDSLIFLWILLLLVGLVGHLLVRFILVMWVGNWVKQNRFKWDDEVLQRPLLKKLSSLIAIFLMLGVYEWLTGRGGVEDNARDYIDGWLWLKTPQILIAGAWIWVCLVISKLADGVEKLYSKSNFDQSLPVRSFVQTIKVSLFVLGVVLVFATVSDQSVGSILAGFGALMAVILIVFKDAILGLVAGIQIASNDLVRKGDWVELPQFGADGEVEELALTTVKVRNWDKTCTSVPSYALVSQGVKNWRNISQGNVRRVKRSLFIDMNSIHFLKKSQFDRLMKLPLLQDYLVEKAKEIKSWNTQHQSEDVLGQRNLTNLGTFRAYLIAYLKKSELISKENTLLVRQLQPTTEGLPLEVYVFLKENRWVPYEMIQSDLFDHFLSILSEFGLQVFQAPGGSDLEKLKDKKSK